jgi:lipid A 3-O-deacylase
MKHSLKALVATATVVTAGVCGAGPAHAENFFEEVRVAAFDHDTALVGSSKEDGADIGVEVLSRPISNLRLIGEPRLALGVNVNTAGQTNQIYAGLNAQWPFARDTFQHGDAFFIEGSVGVTYHDGKLDVTNTPENEDWKSHGSNFLFRTGFGAGYRFNEHWAVSAALYHISNANLAQPNQGSNNAGIQLGYRF